LKLSYACGLGKLIAWYLVDKRGVKVDPWEGGGLGFDPNWKRMISWCVGGGHIMRWWIDRKARQQVLKVKNYFIFYI
jgi:hypothetical protein